MSDVECSKLILHKRCVEMPRQIEHPSHPEHPLTLCIHPYGRNSRFRCDLCGESCENVFCYNCCHCEFDIDISCKELGTDDNYIFQDQRFLLHPCHKHPLMLQRKPASTFLCDGCGTNEGKEMAYTCGACELWVHKSCASFPMEKEVYHHHHSLLLAFSFPLNHRKYLYEYKCDICRGYFCPTYWVYYCNRCRFFAHVKCATRENINLLTAKEEDDDSDHVIQLPHPLSLIKVDDDDDHGKNELKICDLCITPILSPPYYSCADCKYFVHLTCYLLPKTIHDDDPLNKYDSEGCQNHKLTLFASSGNPDEWFLLCRMCDKVTTGIAYLCQACNVMIDVKCASLPTIIKHASHRNHKLIKRVAGWLKYDACYCCAKSMKAQDTAYFCNNNVCKDLDFVMCIGCATLPPSIKHRWDKHPLLLTHDAYIDHPSEFYCEACEEEIEPKRWMYHCRECDQSFHIRCLTESGHHKNIKFGRKFEFGGLHPHPFTFNKVSLKFKCDGCGEIVYEHSGFECASNCNYALCRDCVPM
ncbi:hypothetical protein CDL12_10546 [Handroanthus impetiginosus]|uniref:Zinc finger PHD-type domain-containing protein n=1 Tax=Handroanthus impetiginosus TaxID=429701 RepID=A0A2G9HH36_9LAMI|nr:hypothetical protein CDL12_10546 [Handroanthus impetiginosus]